MVHASARSLRPMSRPGERVSRSHSQIRGNAYHNGLARRPRCFILIVVAASTEALGDLEDGEDGLR